MKRFVLPMIILAVMALGIAPLNAQKSEKKAEEFKNLTALIESDMYIFHVQSVSPTGARTVQSSPGFAMSVNQGVYKAYLPYIGRSYQTSYGGDGGIEFSGEPEDLEITQNEKKRMVSVKFKIDGENDRYTVQLEAGSKGFASLFITSQKRQAISYYGSIGALQTN